MNKLASVKLRPDGINSSDWAFVIEAVQAFATVPDNAIVAADRRACDSTNWISPFYYSEHQAT